ncbi:acetylcholine receptor subunit beta-like 1 [Ostrea edulis]|uniref:acetylcholine receptor subunit beta-like 1 n=1 Tax=Ostrea edulis TaxID=37623 RepID=UPI0024AF2574|nr:acetylcholine receptor subunit beta-like 1 [Ostrea edulis]
MKKPTGLENLTWKILCLLFIIYPNSAQPNEASRRLSTDLMKNYNKMIRGVKDMGEITTLRIHFSLIRIAEFDEVNGKLSLVGFFGIFWNDYRMAWDPEQYYDTYTILFEEKEVWRPLIVLASPQEEFKRLGHDDNFFVRFNPEGYAEWYPGDIWATACTPDVYTYPYDTQTCVVTYVIWAYAVHEVTVKVLSDTVSLHVYTPHGMWDLIDTSVTSNVDVGRGLTLIDITLVMKRISTFHLINMILPIVFVGLLNILVFLLPAQSGERVGYSITVLLAIAVFQTIASDNLPSVSKPQLSLLCIKLLVDLILSALVTMLTIVTLYFYHMPESRRVPSCVASVTSFVLCKNCCKDKPNVTLEKHGFKNGIDAIESVSVNDNHSGDVTWTDVGKSSDIVFAVFSLLTFLASNLVFVLYVA